MSPEIELIDCGGHIRITGQIVCKLWLHPKATVGFASQAVIEDIVRSLAARLEMHWDSLTEEEHGSPEGGFPHKKNVQLCFYFPLDCRYE